MAIINGTNFNDNDTVQAISSFPFIQFFSRLDGTSGDDSIFGFGGNDILNGFNGNDLLDGGTGVDAMNGGDGSDTYFVDNAGDTTTENFNDSLGGVDTVNSSVSWALGFGFENLNLSGTALSATGNSNNNTINGNSSANTIDGGTGADVLHGGDGSDTYFVDNVGDTTSEIFNDALGGVDTVNASASHTIGFGIENLNLTGTAANGTGNSNNNIINGNSSANVIDGGTGADTMHGGDGNDTYFVDNTGDVVSEFFNDALGGVDTVNSSVSFGPLGFGIENLNLTGVADINGAGNENNNVINGNSAANAIDGGTGADTMHGGDGNDTYFVDNTGDVVSEFFNDALGGVDIVNSSVSFGPLGFGIENLNLTGAGAINGTGNENNNFINGNSAANVIDGGTGADTMNAGDGSDTYFVDNVGDVVSENFNDALGGVDTVNSSVSFGPLGFGIENLNLTGVANINGGGNANNNVINGNAGINTLDGADGNDKLNGFASNDILNGGNGNDVLNGGVGADTMTGGLGNDTYFINAAADVVVEAAGVGTGVDLVNSAISHTLGLNLENLTLLGATNLNGNGNTLNNVIRGNAGNNILNGNAGNDNLIGNAGNDTLNGGAGNDTINGGDGNDLIIGSTGQDNMTGGLGADTFDFNSVAESPNAVTRDIINNFSFSEGDKIDLVTIDADLTLAGNQAFGVAQLSFNTVTSIFTADVIGGADLSINLVGVQPGFLVGLDVIA